MSTFNIQYDSIDKKTLDICICVYHTHDKEWNVIFINLK